MQAQEEELGRAKSELNRLQQEETQLEQSIQAGKVQLETIIKSLKSTQEEINQVPFVLFYSHNLAGSTSLAEPQSQGTYFDWMEKG